MDNVRNDVAAILAGNSSSTSSTSSSITTTTTTTNQLVYIRLLKMGRRGDDVKELQQVLIKLGYSVGSYGADGDFGQNTRDAVIKFQRDNSLDDDGEVGPLTIEAINKKLSKSTSTASSSTTATSTTTATIPAISNGLYRVRKAWNNVNSQVGAFKSLENAKTLCDRLGPGYYVFDANGKAIYPTSSSTSSYIVQTPTSNQSVTPAKTYSGVVIGSASKDENGRYVGGQAGDQTGKEVWTLNWYDQSWTSVLRPFDAQLAENIARQCENACANNKIGYSQTDRNTLLQQAKRVGYDMSKITTPCNCDCSSFVSAVCVCCGLPESIFFPGGNGCVTSTIGPACLSTGKFQELTDMKYRNQKDYLKRGDILVNRNQHVVIVLSNGGKA